MSPPPVATVAPDFSLADPDGRRHVLAAAAAAGPVALLFFKRGCAASDLAVAAVEALHRGHLGHEAAEGTRLQVLGVSQDAAEPTRGYCRERGLSYPVLVDGDLEVSRRYDIDTTPTLLLLRGSDRLRAAATAGDAADALRVVASIEGWSREEYTALTEDIAARIGTLPVDLFAGAGSVAPSLPG